MATDRKTNIIPYVALDSNIIIALSVYEKHGEDIRNILEKNRYDSSAVKDLVKQNYYMRKEFSRFDENDKCAKLELIAFLYFNLRKNKIKAYITKTVFGELGLMPKNVLQGVNSRKLYKQEVEIKDFLENPKNHVTVLTVDKENIEDFAKDKLTLALAYVEAGAMGKEYNPFLEDYYPSTDALIMAETSLFGLFLITLNEKHFVHMDCYDNDGRGDFQRATLIEEANTAYGLRFITNRGYLDPPKPIPLDIFINRFKLRYTEARAFFTRPHIDMETEKVLYNQLEKTI